MLWNSAQSPSSVLQLISLEINYFIDCSVQKKFELEMEYIMEFSTPSLISYLLFSTESTEMMEIVSDRQTVCLNNIHHTHICQAFDKKKCQPARFYSTEWNISLDGHQKTALQA